MLQWPRVPVTDQLPCSLMRFLQASGHGAATCGCRRSPRSARRWAAFCTVPGARLHNATWAGKPTHPAFVLPAARSMKCCPVSCLLRVLQEVADLISQCMSLDPSERPTAQQLMQRLQDLHKHNGPNGHNGAVPSTAAAAAANGPSKQPPASPAAADATAAGAGSPAAQADQ